LQGIPFRIIDFRQIQLPKRAGFRFPIKGLGILHRRPINDELTGNLGDAIENTSIGDCRLFRPLAENFSQRNFGIFATLSALFGNAACRGELPLSAQKRTSISGPHAHHQFKF
jgi:hypothetical protein